MAYLRCDMALMRRCGRTSALSLDELPHLFGLAEDDGSPIALHASASYCRSAAFRPITLELVLNLKLRSQNS